MLPILLLEDKACSDWELLSWFASLLSLLSDEELPDTDADGVVDEFSDTIVGCVPGNAGKSSLLMVNSVDSDVGAFTIPTANKDITPA